MKRLLLIICTLLCTNVLLAQTTFWIDGLQYEITSTNPAEVEVNDANVSITTANIPETVTDNGTTYSVTSIGEVAFGDCISLTSVTIPNSVTSIGNWAFCFCISLTSITIPNSVTSIGQQAFYGCSSLTSVTLPNNATIDESAFDNAGPFSQRDIGIDNIIYRTKRTNGIIGNYTFNNVGEITFYLNGNTYNLIGNVMVHMFHNNNPILNIPETINYNGATYRVTEIGQQAFYLCSSLTSVTIPNSVTSIGGHAFWGCSSLTSVTIPNSVTSIGGGAFMDCISLTSVILPNNATIDEYAFYNAGPFSQNDITIDNIIYRTKRTNVIIGNYTFNSVGEITFYLNGNTYIPDKQAKVYDASYNIVIANIPSTISYNDTIYSVTSIGVGAFYNCSSLSSVTIPNSVTEIGAHAFRKCSDLTSVTIPNSVTSIGDSAFRNCSSLTSITIPNSVTSIGQQAFSYCSDLTSVTIPNSVTSIVEEAFNGCTNLTSVSLDMSSIPANLFPQSVPLQNLTFGENVTSIASGAFSTYSFLQNVTCLATTPPTLADNTVFPYPNIATLTVPCGTLEAYSAPTSFWNMFFMGRIEEDCSGESGLEDLNAVDISFFPNPTKSEITFSQAIEKVEVIDLTGKAILTFTNAKTINIESLPAGAYYLRLTNNDKAVLRKLIKE